MSYLFKSLNVLSCVIYTVGLSPCVTLCILEQKIQYRVPVGYVLSLLQVVRIDCMYSVYNTC
jgi:hypothetical protein